MFLFVTTQHFFLQANIFLEPFSFDVHHNMTFRMPSLMYGTQLSEEGLPCAIKGFDYKALYNIWKCPKIMMNVAVRCIIYAT